MDGFGVVKCDECDYCTHACRVPVGNEGGWRCELCDYEVDP
jgi:hypothetical protein